MKKMCEILWESIDGQTYTTKYEYDQYSNLSKTTYPSGFEVKNSYDDTKGFLTGMYNDNNTFYTPQQYNALGQLKQYKFSNSNTAASFTYNANHLPDLWQIGNWQYDYDFDAATGNLNSRKQTSTPALTETFTAYNMNRLTTAQVTGQTQYTTTYHNNGNIKNKSDVSTTDYIYDQTKINAVKKIENPTSAISSLQQDITYTAFNKAETITEGAYTLTYTYGSDQQRKKSVLTTNNQPLTTIIYAGNYEVIKTGSDEYKVCYLPSPQGLQIVAVKKNTDTENIYYIYTDHLGSLLKVTKADGTVVYEQNFDAWGRERDPSDWTPLLRGAGGVSKPDWLIRGYTGHEHLPEFALINMNGRMYDPVLGRMLSPDNYVQDATGTQGYNRYSYALNNPLVYTDPSGEYNTYNYLPSDFWNEWWEGERKQIDATNKLVIVAASANIGAGISALEIPMANTLGIAGASLSNSIGNYFYTGGETDISVSFGFGSYNFTDGEFRSIFDWNDLSTGEKIGYSLGTLANLSDVVNVVDYYAKLEEKWTKEYYDAVKNNTGELDENTLHQGVGKSNYVGGKNAVDINGDIYYGAKEPRLMDISAQAHDIGWDQAKIQASLSKFLTSNKALGADWQLAGRSLYLGLKNLTSVQGLESLGLGTVSTLAFTPKTIAIPLITAAGLYYTTKYTTKYGYKF